MAESKIEDAIDRASKRLNFFALAGSIKVAAVVAALLGGTVGGVAGGIVGYSASRWQGSALDLRARPRVAVVSYAAALENTSAEQVAARMAALDAKAQRLSDAGFVVLNDNALVAWPSGLQVPVNKSHE